MVNFVVDSTFGLTKEFAAEHNIGIVSLTLLLDGKEYSEGCRESWDEFYTAYSSTKSPASTSQPSPECFAQAITRHLEADPDGEVIVFTIGDRLSGTVSAAKIAALQFPQNKVAVMDSHNAGVSGYMFLKHMLKFRDTGATFEEVVAHAEKIRDNFSTRFIPLTLTELARGGRVNKIISCIGNILNIKPVIEYRANELKILTKSLGMQRAIKTAVEDLPAKLDDVCVMYIHDDSQVERLKSLLMAKYGLDDIDVEPMCPVGGAHIGIGTVGIISCFSDDAK